MDLLRSCSRQDISFVAGGSGPLVEATWYYAARTAKPFPIPHVFSSPVWDNEHPTLTPLGFQAQRPRRYVNGRRRNTSDGTQWAGPLNYFAMGSPGLFSLPRGVNDTPVECLLPPQGLALGGEAQDLDLVAGGQLLGGFVDDVGPSWICGLCADATPSTVEVTGSGFSVGIFNALFSLPKSATPCIWRRPVSTGFVEAERHHLDGWIIRFDDGLGNAAQYSNLFDADCLGSKTVSQAITNMGGDPTLPVFGNP